MPDLNQERTLGKLLAKVENIEKELTSAGERRAAVHQRVDVVVADIGGLKRDFAALAAEVRDTKDVTDEVRRWKHMGIGALAVVGIGATAIGALIVVWFERFLHFLRPV